MKTGKVLRILAIVALAGTAFMTLASGVGTTCLAFHADQYGRSFAAYVPYMSLYQIFVYIAVLLGIAGCIITYALAARDGWAYWGAVIFLALGLVEGGVHMYNSINITDKALPMPISMRVMITFISLVLFLVLRLPGIWKWVGFAEASPKGGSKAATGGVAAITGGVLALTTPLWAGASHMLGGYNLVNVLLVPLMVGGGLLVAVGISLLAMAALHISPAQVASWFRASAASLIRPVLSKVR